MRCHPSPHLENHSATSVDESAPPFCIGAICTGKDPASVSNGDRASTVTRQSACNQKVACRFSRSSAVCFQEILQFKPQNRRHVRSCLSKCFTRARCRLGCQTAVSLDSMCWVCISFCEGILFRCWISASLSFSRTLCSSWCQSRREFFHW